MAKLLGRENFSEKGDFSDFLWRQWRRKNCLFITFFADEGGGNPDFALTRNGRGQSRSSGGGDDHPPPIGFRGNRLCPPQILAEKA